MIIYTGIVKGQKIATNRDSDINVRILDVEITEPEDIQTEDFEKELSHYRYHRKKIIAAISELVVSSLPKEKDTGCAFHLEYNEALKEMKEKWSG